MVNVFLTVDTECSMGGALGDSKKRPVDPEKSILGRIDRKHYGTPAIMHLLEQNALRGTFFLEVLASRVVNRQQMADAYGEILARGHDVQLHLHPVYYYYDLLRQNLISREQLPAHPDLIGTLPDSVQLQLLCEGVKTFQEFTGISPVAFRAGSWGASHSTLGILPNFGIQYDSSFNSAALEKSCLLNSRNPTNLPWKEGQVWELPMTNFESNLGPFRSLKALNIASVSYAELKGVLDFAESCGMQNVVLIVHSFAFLKRKDVQFQCMRPDRIVMRRFERLCSHLRKNSHRFHVVTLGDRPRFNTSPDTIRFPSLGWYLPMCRKFIQAVNRLYWI